MRKGAILQPWGLDLAVSGELQVVSLIYQLLDVWTASLCVLSDLRIGICIVLLHGLEIILISWDYFNQHLIYFT